MMQELDPARLLQALWEAPLGIAFLDRELRFVRINPRLAEIHGLTAGLNTGKSVEEVLPHIDPEAVMHLRRVLETGAPLEAEVSGIMPGSPGERRHWRVSYFPVRAEEVVVGVGAVVAEITAQKRLEQDLAARAHELETLLDAVPAAVLITRDSLAGRAEGNRVAHELLGVPSGGNLSKAAPEHERPGNFRVFRDGVEIPARELPLETAARGVAVPQFECQLVFDDGSVRHILGNAVPLRDDAGNARGSIAAFVDATAIQQAREDARRSRERLLLAKDAARMGAWDWNLLTGELVWDERCKALFGLPPDAAMSFATFRQAIHPDDRDRVEAAVREALANGSEYDVEMRVARPDGSLRWVASKGRAAFDELGQAVGMAGMALDITDRKCAEETLRQNEARSRAISHNVSDSLVILEAVRDAGGAIAGWRYLDANEGALALVGFTRERLLGRTVREVLPELSAVLEERMARVAATGASERYETSFRDQTLLVTLFRVDANTIGSAALDITDRKRAELALRESDRRKTEFLRVLSHELRNPLAPIRNSIFVLENLPAGSPRSTRALQAMKRQTAHLTRLVDDLLDVTRISAGKIHLQRERADLREVVRATCEDHREEFEEEQIELHLELPAAPVWVDVDETRIAQVVGNLLNNAIKFTPAGGEVMVRLGVRDGHAEVRMRDTGIGMTAEHLAHAFEPLAQEDHSLARTRGGLGLGLALARGLVELHGGAMAAQSEGPGRGSELVLTLPLAWQGEQPAHPVPLLAGSARRVLVIEDNADAARTLADALDVLGHRVTLASDGRTGIALARELKPEVVICDLGLPDIDGYEVARRLRDEDLAGTRLIALSGYAQPEDLDRARSAGFEAHLTKPAPIEQLTALLAEGRWAGSSLS